MFSALHKPAFGTTQPSAFEVMEVNDDSTENVEKVCVKSCLKTKEKKRKMKKHVKMNLEEPVSHGHTKKKCIAVQEDGFGSTTSQNPFAGQSQLFGKTPTNTFGASTSGFGQPAPNTSLFPSAQQQPTSLFQSTAPHSFGAPSTQPGFGTNLFGNASAQPGPSGLFGSSTFGQANKGPAFGFGAAATQGTSLFGQTQQQPQQSASIFQPSSSTNMFGGSFGQTVQSGTVIKFVPVTGSDTMQKAGIAQSISTKHHCITCMKEYEGKSFEELRWEDYQFGRKGPQQQTGFGAAPFGATQSAQPIFGQQENKPPFGQTGFGQSSTGFGMQQNQQSMNLFSKPNTGFGTTTTSTNTFGFNSSVSNPFAGNAAKPFGTPQTQPLFGASTQQPNTGFGTNIFGQTNTNASNVFGKPVQPTGGFNTGQTGFSFGQSTAPSGGLFQQQKPNTGFPLFGQTNTAAPTFGQQTGFGQTTQSAFGGSSFGKPTLTFGQPTQPSFGGGMQQTGNLFGNVSKPGGLFGNTNTGGLFSSNTFQPSTGFNLQPQQQQQLSETYSFDHATIARMADTFAEKECFKGLLPLRDKESYRTTNPVELKALIDDVDKKIAASGRPSDRIKVVYPVEKRDLFDEITEKEAYDKTFALRHSAKRLNIKHKNVPRSSLHVSVPDCTNEIQSDHTETVTESNLNVIHAKPVDTAAQKSAKKSIFYDKLPEGTSASYPTNPDIDVKEVSVQTADESEELDNSKQPATDSADEIKETQPAKETSSSTSSKTKKSPGVTLTRVEYYTIPPLDELSNYINDEGKCIVKGFTIGRVNYGNIYFPDEVDITGLNFDEIVHFRYREVVIYPDDNKKPPVGQEINKRAQITLDNIWPTDMHNTVIKDPEHVLIINFPDKLKELCEKYASEYKDYRPETGSWVFDVEHFSKYSFADPNNEKPMDITSSSTTETMKSDVSSELNGTLTNKTFNSIIDKQVQDLDKSLSIMHSNLGIKNNTPNGVIIDLNTTIGYNGSFLKDVPLIHLSNKLLQKMSEDVTVMKATLFEDETVSEFTDSEELGIAPEYSYVIGNVEEEEEEEEDVHVEYLHIEDTSDKYEIFKLLPTADIKQKNRGVLDNCVLKSQSFKVGWGYNLKLTGIGLQNEKINIRNFIPPLSSTLIWQVHNLDSSLKDPFENTLLDCLEIFQNNSKIHFNDEDVPYYEIIKGRDLLLNIRQFMNGVALKYKTNDLTEYYSNVWNLCVALWGPALDTPSARRRLFNKWLENIVQQSVSKNMSLSENMDSTEAGEAIFNLLTGHNIKEASKIAKKNKLSNLSLLLSVSSSEHVKVMMNKQIKEWERYRTVEHIDEVLLKIYVLMSGELCRTGVNACASLDWKRSYALHLWYASPLSAPLTHATDLYDKAFQTFAYAVRPLPIYLSNDSLEENVFDVMYHIIKVYGDRHYGIQKILNPLTYTNDANDYRLTWMLMQVFISLNIGWLNENEINYIHLKFATQLEKLGHWIWAIFVLSYIKSDEIKENNIKDILNRNLKFEAGQIVDENDKMLIEKFKIPAKWIHNIKAQKAKVFGKHYDVYNHLALSEQFTECYEYAIINVYPKLMINDQYDILNEMVNPYLKYFIGLPNWNIGGGLLLDFIQLQDKVMSITVYSTCVVAKVKVAIISVCRRINSFPRETPEQVACISKVSIQCLKLLKMIHYGSLEYAEKLSNEMDPELLTMAPDIKAELTQWFKKK